MNYYVLDKIFNQPSILRHIEYLIVDKNLHILDISEEVQRFADSPTRVVKANDVREGFPELIGYEDILFAIIQGQQEAFQLKGVARSLGQHSPPLYIDIYVVLPAIAAGIISRTARGIWVPYSEQSRNSGGDDFL